MGRPIVTNGGICGVYSCVKVHKAIELRFGVVNGVMGPWIGVLRGFQIAYGKGVGIFLVHWFEWRFGVHW